VADRSWLQGHDDSTDPDEWGAAIRDARSPAEVREIANEYRREPDRRKRIIRLKLSKDWRDIGALKRELIEMWTAERNAFAEPI